MTVFTEGRHPGEGLLSEANGSRSRGKATIPSGTGVVEPGAVLGAVRGDVTVTKTDIGGGKGAITLSNPAFGSGVKAGDYKVVFVEPATDAGDFVVEDPNGNIVGNGSVGVEFSGEVVFTIADGATDFAAGDTAKVSVSFADGDNVYVPSPEAETVGSEGAEVASAIALYGCDATSADCDITIIKRDAEWNVNTLSYDASVDDDAKKAIKHAQLSAVGIIAR